MHSTSWGQLKYKSLLCSMNTQKRQTSAKVIKCGLVGAFIRVQTEMQQKGKKRKGSLLLSFKIKKISVGKKWLSKVLTLNNNAIKIICFLQTKLMKVLLQTGSNLFFINKSFIFVIKWCTTRICWQSRPFCVCCHITLPALFWQMHEAKSDSNSLTSLTSYVLQGIIKSKIQSHSS